MRKVVLLLIINYISGGQKKMSVHSIIAEGHFKEEPQTEHQQGYFSDEEEPHYQPGFWQEVFPEFLFKKLLTETESSLIWLGTHKHSSQGLVLKIAQRIQSQSSRSFHQQEEKKFLEKIRIKHMVDVQEIHDSDDYRLFVMKYYPWNLEDLTKKFLAHQEKRYSQKHLQFIGFAFKGILLAVEELHKAGFVHRDLKLDNFMVDSEFSIYLNDFELVTKEGKIDPSLSGTIDYMPPERLSLKKRVAAPIQTSIDVWSLGVMLYELCTGALPYHGHTSEEIEQEIYSRNVVNDDIPVDLMKLIQGMLEIRRDRRLTMDELSKTPLFQSDLGLNDLKELIAE